MDGWIDGRMDGRMRHGCISLRSSHTLTHLRRFRNVGPIAKNAFITWIWKQRKVNGTGRVIPMPSFYQCLRIQVQCGPLICSSSMPALGTHPHGKRWVIDFMYDKLYRVLDLLTLTLCFYKKSVTRSKEEAIQMILGTQSSLMRCAFFHWIDVNSLLDLIISL